MGILDYIRRRPFMMIFAFIGAVVFGIIGNEGRQFINNVERIDRDVQVIRETSPCTGLTSSECALKLFRALPEETRERLRVSQSTIRSLERRARRERAALRRGRDDQPAPAPVGGGSPGRAPGGSSPSSGGRPRPGSSPDTSAGQSPAAPSQQPASPPANEPDEPPNPPVIRTPQVQTPEVGQVPPVTVPSIDIPCVEIKPAVTC